MGPGIEETKRALAAQKRLLKGANQQTEAARKGVAALEAQRGVIADIVRQRAEQAEIEFRIQEKIEAALEPMRRAREAAEATGQAFEDLALNAITNFKNIGEAARDLARTLVNDLSRTLILTPIRESIVGAWRACCARCSDNRKAPIRHRQRSHRHKRRPSPR